MHSSFLDTTSFDTQGAHKNPQFLLAFLILFQVSGCGSANRKADKSQAEVNETIEESNEKRLDMLEESEKCIKKAGSDATAAAQCDSCPKAAEALGQ